MSCSFQLFKYIVIVYVNCLKFILIVLFSYCECRASQTYHTNATIRASLKSFLPRQHRFMIAKNIINVIQCKIYVQLLLIYCNLTSFIMILYKKATLLHSRSGHMTRVRNRSCSISSAKASNSFVSCQCKIELWGIVMSLITLR